MVDSAQRAYPADRWIRLKMVDGRMIPAFPPQAVRDALQAYDAFLYGGQDEIKNQIAREMETRWGEVAANKRDFDDAEMDDVFGPCTVHEDGTVMLEDNFLSRTEIFAAYGVDDVAQTPGMAV